MLNSNLSKNDIEKELARRKFRNFIAYNKSDYEFNWHHEYIIKKLEDFVSGKIKRLMVFAPPRHGKSEIVSRQLPAYILGKIPTARIIACSYSAELASAMNRDVQRIMTDTPYLELFPESALTAKHSLKNNTRFDVPSNTGYYYCAGVGGSITGLGADFAIIDDPVKNSEEAASITFQKKQWEWYATTLYTRLEKDARLLITLTRWHEEDLAGKLLNLMEQNKESDQWEIISLPAIKESDENNYDTRAINEPLWNNKYDLHELERIKISLGSRDFNALYQQRPAPLEGGIIKKDWFNWYDPKTIDLKRHTINFFMDTAFTAKKSNDPSALLACFKKGKDLYLVDCRAVWKEFPDLIRFIKEFCKINGYKSSSRICVEPKASGKSVIQQIRAETGLNIIEDKTLKNLQGNKFARVNAISAMVEAGRVHLPLNSNWTDTFLHECLTFPNGKHDDRVDCLVMALNTTLKKSRRGYGIANLPSPPKPIPREPRKIGVIYD